MNKPAPTLLLDNVTVLTPEERRPGPVLLRLGRIAAVGAEAAAAGGDARRLDGSGLLVAPGFIELQLNGGWGHDFTRSPETIWQVAAELPQTGVTAFLPTVITSPLETVARAQQVVGRAQEGFAGALPLGLHLEGPFLNPEKRGAHPPAFLRRPEADLVSGWTPAEGVRLVTLAPELPGALSVVRRLQAQGVVVSAGHSQASYEEAQAGFAAGISYGTHLFNAMPPLHHRRPGLVGALLDADQVTVGLIPDGIHVHPALLRLAWRQLRPARLSLVTDAMAALGLGDGRYDLGAQAVTVRAGEARLAGGTLAGSVLSLDEALRRFMAFTGCSLVEALPAVTTTPARLLGLAEERGRVAPGYAADLVLLTPEFEVAATFAGGRLLYRREDLLDEPTH